MLFTYKGMAVRFDEAKVRPMGRLARGVKGVTLRDDEAGKDYIVGCEVVNGDETVLVVCENGFGKRSRVEDFRQTNRGGVGVRSIQTSDRNGNVVGALCVTNNDGIVMISSLGQTVRIPMRDLRVLGRNTQGVKLVNLREVNDYLVAIQKIEESDSPTENREAAGAEPVNGVEHDAPIEAIDGFADEEVAIDEDIAADEETRDDEDMAEDDKE
jgi:DNA gyrase subunit A